MNLNRFYSFASLLFFALLNGQLQAQIIIGADTLYGNEWINFNQSYFKIMLAEDGIYRIPYQALSDAGVPISSVPGAQFQLFHNGEEIPLHTSNDATFGTSDYLEFFGKKNTSELDKHLFKDPEAEMMNPYYSFITDTAAYFLTWNPSGAPIRYQTIQNDLTNLPSKEEYIWYELSQVLTGGHDKRRNSEGVRNSYFEIAEGYSGGYAQTQNFNITPVQPFIGNQNATLSLRYACALGQHNQVIKINGLLAASDQFADFQVKNHSLEVTNASLSSQIQVTFEGTASNNDKQRVAFISLKYPRLLDAQNQAYFAFSVAASTEKKYLEITGFNAGTAPVMYDLTNHLRLQATIDGNVVKIMLPSSNVERQLVLVNQENAIKSANNLSPVQFINYLQNEGNYIIISNRKLYDDGNGLNWVQEYANYRASVAGGNFSPVVVEIQQLYDQFAWGINRHPFSIRNFAQYILKKWSEPKYIFIIGKGREYTSIRSSSALNDPASLPLYVPTFGSPGSDNLLAATNWSIQPGIATSRLSAVNAGEIKLYLDKVKAFEASQKLPQTIADKQWMKRIMHLGGGAPGGEQELIRSQLAAMENIMEDGTFGGQVYSFFKTSADPIQVSQTDLITELINGGVSMMTFFGHASSGGFDFTVDDPSTYLNKDKYPLVLSLGCYSGAIHSNFKSVGEHFVFQENKGAIGFLATNGYGYIHALSNLTQKFYSKMGGEFYNNGIAENLRKAIGDVLQSDYATLVLAQQFTLNGDPALVLNGFPAPDFLVDAASAKINVDKITAQLSNFTFSFNVANIGRAISDSLVVEVSREFPNGNIILVERRKIPSPKYETNLHFIVPVNGMGIGFNKLHVRLDPENLVQEQYQPAAENNNSLVSATGEEGFRFYVFANGAIPVYPENFSIVSSPNPSLRAVSSDVFAPKQRYFLELDTTELFNSPFKKGTVIEQSGGVVEWLPGGISWLNETVYYWRISPDTLDGQGYTWSNSSFLYLENSPDGWNQSHFFQLKKDQFFDTELPESTRRLKFLDDVKIVRATGGIFPTYYPQYFFGDEYYPFVGGPVSGGVYAFVFDSVTVASWQNTSPGLYGSQLPGGGPTAIFPFSTQTPEERQILLHFLQDTVPDGNYVMISTQQNTSGSNYEPEEWAADSLIYGTNLFQLLEEQGAKIIRSTAVSGATPYVLVYKKNDPEFPAEEVLYGLYQNVDKNFGLPGFWYEGSVESTNIGPAERWDSLAWNTFEFDPAFDRQQFDVFGIKADNSKVLLFENVQAASLDLSPVNAVEFPFLKLRFSATDSMHRTPPQIGYWRVFYKSLPDASIHPAGHFSFYRDTLQEGETLRFESAVRNLTPLEMDSLLVKFFIVNEQNQAVESLTRLAPLPADGQLQADFQWNTKGLRGRQQLWMEVNPNQDQRELHSFNNVAIRDFFVQSDRSNPLVDVTFDGTHILDGDLVSARPEIMVSIEDENPFLALDDTSLFKIFLLYPDSGGYRNVYVPFDGQTLQFQPADLSAQGGKNRAKLRLQPQFVEDGTYGLLVQSKDASNNAAGAYDYKISFRVITKSMISNVLNYPNPFSTATRFVYTLTGEEPPAQFKIQILTISGKIVREITQDEIGQLRIGTHKTDFVWDGTDEFGDRLANGVYLYRVLARKANGEEIELMENAGTDKYFKKGYGKMVIVR